MADFNLSTVPLAIIRRFEELDLRVRGLEGQNERDGAEITQLRDQITVIKNRIEARVPDLNALFEQREALAFAVKAYQDEAIEQGRRVEPGPKPAGLAAPPATLHSAVETKKEQVYEVVRSAGYPIKAGEISRALGLGHPTAVSRYLGLLSDEHRITPAEEGGWMASSGQE